MRKFTQAKRLNRHLRQQKVFNNCLQLLSFINQRAIRTTRQLASDTAIAALLLFIDYKTSRKPSSQSNFISLLNIRFFSRFSDERRQARDERGSIPARPALAFYKFVWKLYFCWYTDLHKSDWNSFLRHKHLPEQGIINKKSLHDEVLLLSMLILVSRFTDRRKRHVKNTVSWIEQNWTKTNGRENYSFYSI